jgi:ABC-2 type transport system permease protein
VISFYTQSAISLPLPFVSVLLMTQDFGHQAATTLTSGRSPDVIIAAKLLASMIIALVGATYGVLISVLGTSAAAPAAEEGRWGGAIGMIILGSVLVQLIAQLSGAGWGLLLGSSAVAITADVVVPLGLWIVTGAVPGLQSIQEWLAPFASVQNLLSGHMDAQGWAQVGVIVLVWVIALNVAGLLRVRRRGGSVGR